MHDYAIFGHDRAAIGRWLGFIAILAAGGVAQLTNLLANLTGWEAFTKGSERDAQYSGNLKKVVRLLKNIVADMPAYKKNKAKALTSYDLAGIAYHMDERLNIPSYMSLALVEQSRDFIGLLKYSETYRNTLQVPDDTRKIFDKDSKTEALEILSKEIDDLAYSIFKELRPALESYDSDVITSKVII